MKYIACFSPQQNSEEMRVERETERGIKTKHLDSSE